MYEFRLVLLRHDHRIARRRLDLLPAALHPVRLLASLLPVHCTANFILSLRLLKQLRKVYPASLSCYVLQILNHRLRTTLMRKLQWRWLERLAEAMLVRVDEVFGACRPKPRLALHQIKTRHAIPSYLCRHVPRRRLRQEVIFDLGQ